jgi:hypothetical protein
LKAAQPLLQVWKQRSRCCTVAACSLPGACKQRSRCLKSSAAVGAGLEAAQPLLHAAFQAPASSAAVAFSSWLVFLVQKYK